MVADASRTAQAIAFSTLLIVLHLVTTATAAPLTGTDVEPASLVAGATGTVTVTFTTDATTGSLPADGKVLVTFPAGFDVSGANTPGCLPSLDGGFAVGVAGQVVTITRDGTGTDPGAGAAVSCTLAGVRNPQVSGSTGTYSVETRTAADATIDGPTIAAADTITPGALGATNVQPASLVAGATGTVTLTFTTANPVPADGKVVAVFPAGFDVSGAAGGTCSSMDGTFTTGVAGQTVTLTRNGDGTAEPAGAQTCTVGTVRNPQVSGSTGTYTLRTTDTADAAVDQDTAVSADTITAGALGATNVEPASLTVSASSTVTATFTTINPVPADGKVVVIFPAGFDVSGAAGGTCGSMDGTFTTGVAGQTVTLTRNGDGTAEPAGAQTCTVTTIVNPGGAGTTGTYTLRTTNAADAAIDQDTAVPGDPIAAAALGAPVVSLAPTSINAASTATVTFTTSLAVPADGAVVVVFPAGFDVSGAAGGTCGSMDGTFTTGVAAQTVTLTRNGDGTSEPAGAQTCTLPGLTNPAAAGITATFTLSTLDGASATIETAAAPGFNIRSGGGGGSGTGGSHGWTVGTFERIASEPGTRLTFPFDGNPVRQVTVVLDRTSTGRLVQSVQDGAPGDLPPGFEATVLVVDLSFDGDGNVQEVTLEWAIPEHRLSGPWTSWTVLHWDGNGWVALPTEASEVDGVIILRAVSPGLSPFAIAVDHQEPTGDVEVDGSTLLVSWSDNRAAEGWEATVEVDGQEVAVDDDDGSLSLDLEPGSHDVVLTIVDGSGMSTEVRETVLVSSSSPPPSPPAEPPVGNGTESAGDDGKARKTPGLGLVGLLAAVGVAAMAARRRR